MSAKLTAHAFAIFRKPAPGNQDGMWRTVNQYITFVSFSDGGNDSIITGREGIN